MCSQKYFRAGGIVELGHFDKHFDKNKRKRGPVRKDFVCILTEIMKKFNPMIDKIRAFLSKIRTFFSIFIKGTETSPLLSSCAPVSVAEYASISLNMPKYPWICLNKLFWLCQGPEYACSSYMFERLLKMPPVLNKPGFWIWHGFIWKGYAEFIICLIIWLHRPQHALIMFLNMPEHDWILLNVPECPWKCLNKLFWRYQGSQYAAT